MASKVQAAKMAAYSGVTTVIARADLDDVLAGAIDEREGIGTIVRPQPRPLSAKKLWIAFALERRGAITVDSGARGALERQGSSLLAVGVRAVDGAFRRGDAVDVADPSGEVFARGLAAMDATELTSIVGTRSSEHPDGTPDEVIHRDELVVLS